MEKNTRKIEPGTPTPDPKYHLEITADGPYLVYGNPPLQQEIFVLNKEQIPWEYAKGHKYPTDNEPTALCRCGQSKNHPYCDGSHHHADWDPTLTAGNIPLLENADLYDGPGVQLADNTEYCVHARFCMARGTVWQLTEDSDNTEAHDLAVHESMYCPSGRPNGTEYEQRNRVTLCRCGASANKPYCDGTHVTVHFQDHLPLSTELEEKMK